MPIRLGRGWNSDLSDLPGDPMARMRVAGLGQGDQNAPDIAQEPH